MVRLIILFLFLFSLNGCSESGRSLDDFYNSDKKSLNAITERIDEVRRLAVGYTVSLAWSANGSTTAVLIPNKKLVHQEEIITLSSEHEYYINHVKNNLANLDSIKMRLNTIKVLANGTKVDYIYSKSSSAVIFVIDCYDESLMYQPSNGDCFISLEKNEVEASMLDSNRNQKRYPYREIIVDKWYKLYQIHSNAIN